MEHNVYLIDYDDVRFSDTLTNWAEAIDDEFNANPLITNFDYCSNMVLQTMLDIAPETKVGDDIRYLLKFLRQHTQLDMYWLAYPTNYVSERDLNAILMLHLLHRKKKDYILKMMSSAELTFRVNEKLLQYPVPDINIIVISKV